MPEIYSSQIFTVESPEQLYNIVHDSRYERRLLVLMCKAKTCRPCKIFQRKYERLAAQYPGVIFMQILGDSTMETRGLMMKMGVKVTPTFRLYKNEKLAEVVTGINETKLADAIDLHYEDVCALRPPEGVAQPAA